MTIAEVQGQMNTVQPSTLNNDVSTAENVASSPLAASPVGSILSVFTDDWSIDQTRITNSIHEVDIIGTGWVSDSSYEDDVQSQGRLDDLHYLHDTHFQGANYHDWSDDEDNHREQHSDDESTVAEADEQIQPDQGLLDYFHRRYIQHDFDFGINTSWYDAAPFEEAALEPFTDILVNAVQDDTYDDPSAWDASLIHDIETNPGPSIYDYRVNGDTCECHTCSFPLHRSVVENTIVLFTSMWLPGADRTLLLERIHDLIPMCHGRDLMMMNMMRDVLGIQPQMMAGIPIAVKLDEKSIDVMNDMVTKLSSSFSAGTTLRVDMSDKTSKLATKVTDTVDACGGFIATIAQMSTNKVLLACVMGALLLMNHACPSTTVRFMICTVGAWAAYQFASTKFAASIMEAIMNCRPQAMGDDLVILVSELVSFGFFGKTLDFSNITAFNATFKLFASGSESVDRFSKRVIAWFKSLFAFLGEHCGVLSLQEYGEHRGAIAAIQTELKELVDQYMVYSAQDPATGVPVDAALTNLFMTRVVMLDRRVMDVLVDIKSGGQINEAVRKCLMEVKNRLAPLKSIAAKNGMAKGRRVAPKMWFFCGAPQVGKSFFQEAHALRTDMVLRTKADLLDMAENKSRRFFSLKKGEKHFDTYGGHSIMAIADAFTEKDAPGQPSEASFIINNLGNNPDPLPAAALELKGTIFAQNRILTIASNMCTITPTAFAAAINNVDALKARLNKNAWRIVPAEGFHRPIVGKENEGVQRPNDVPESLIERYRSALDLKKVMAAGNGGLFMDCYEIIAWDVTSNSPRTTGERNGCYVFKGPGSFDSFCRYSQEMLVSHIRNDASNMMAQNALLDLHLVTAAGHMADTDVFVPEPYVPQAGSEVQSEDWFSTDSVLGQLDDYEPGKVMPVFQHLSTDKVVSVADILSQDQEFVSYLIEYYEIILAGGDPGWYQDDIDHPYTIVAARLSQLEMEYLVTAYKGTKRSGCFDIARELVRSTGVGVRRVRDIVHASLMATSRALGRFIDLMAARSANPFLWIVEYPNFKSMMVGGAAATAFWALFQMLRTWNEPPIVPMWDGKQLAHLMTDSYQDGVHDTVLYYETLADSNGISLAKFPRPFVPQSSAEDYIPPHIKSFISSRAQNCYHVVVNRVKATTGQRVNRAVCSIKFVGEYTAMSVAHLYWTIQSFIAQGDTEIKIILTSYHNLHMIGEQGFANYIFDYSDVLWTRPDERVDRIFLSFPPSKMTLFTYLVDEYPSADSPGYMSWLKDGLRKDAVMVVKIEEGGYSMKPCQVWWDGGDIHYNYSATLDVNPPVNVSVPFIHNKNTLKTSLKTKQGWCGAEIWIVDTGSHKLKDGMFRNPFPVYMHTGESATYGVGLMTCREDFKGVPITIKSKHTSKEVLESSTALMKRYVEELALKLEIIKPQECVIDEVCYDNSDMTNHSWTIDEIPKHATVLEVMPAPFVSMASAIKRSAMYDDLQIGYAARGFAKTRRPIKTYTHTGADGKLVNPLAMATSKYGTNAQDLPTEQVSFIINKVVMDIYLKTGKPSEDQRKPLTFRELMQGLDGVRKKPRDNTSAGYTFTAMKKALGWGAKGRRDFWCNETGINFDSPQVQALEKCVMEALATVRRGQRLCNINVDHLKDELRTPEKCDDGKARLFCAQELIYLLVCHMLFYPFVDWMIKGRIRNGSTVGINPYGEEWKSLYEHLTAKSPDGIFGDYGSYDKTLFVTWQKSVSKLYRLYYGDSHPDLLAMDMLLEDMISSYHVVNVKGVGYLYRWDWGNTSGNFLTTIINGVANNCLVVFACVCVKMGGLNVLRNTPVNRLGVVADVIGDLAIAIYGDDNAIFPGPSLPEIDFFAIRAAFLEIGIEYTDELKGLAGLCARKPIEDGSLIGRGFKVVHTYPYEVRSPLRLYSILESLMWDKTGKEDRKIMAEKCRNAAAELSQHGDEVFNTYYSLLRDTAQKHNVEPPEFSCCNDALDHVRSMSTPYSEY
jgi:hypothetical protein